MCQTLCLFVLLYAAVVGAQTRPYYGIWKVNSARSDLKGVTATSKDLGDGRVEISGRGQKDTFVIGMGWQRLSVDRRHDDAVEGLRPRPLRERREARRRTPQRDRNDSFAGRDHHV